MIPSVFSQAKTIRFFYDQTEGPFPASYLFFNEFDPAVLDKNPFISYNKVYYNKYNEIIRVDHFGEITYHYSPVPPPREKVELKTDSTDDKVLAMIAAKEKELNEQYEREYQEAIKEFNRKNSLKWQEIILEMKQRHPEKTVTYEYDNLHRLMSAEVSTPNRRNKYVSYHIVYNDEHTGDVYKVDQSAQYLAEKIILDNEGLLIEKVIYDSSEKPLSTRYFFYNDGSPASFGSASMNSDKLWTREYQYEANSLTGYIDFDENNEIIKEFLPVR